MYVDSWQRQVIGRSIARLWLQLSAAARKKIKRKQVTVCTCTGGQNLKTKMCSLGRGGVEVFFFFFFFLHQLRIGHLFGMMRPWPGDLLGPEGDQSLKLIYFWICCLGGGGEVQGNSTPALNPSALPILLKDWWLFFWRTEITQLILFTSYIIPAKRYLKQKGQEEYLQAMSDS